MEIEKNLPALDKKSAGELAELFKYFGDQTRIRILALLCRKEENVCNIAGELCMSQSAISHQLNILRKGRLVRTRREGKTVVYALDDGHVSRILRCGMEHVTEGESK